MGPPAPPLLKIENLSVTYFPAAGPVRAVREFSLEMDRGESIALVGETGSGKSTVGLALLGLLATPGSSEMGEIYFEGTPLSTLNSRAWREVRGRKIGMIFQDARGALNPVLTVGAQLTQALQAHQRLSRIATIEAAVELLTLAGIPEPRFYLHRYPIELSGGMCQRVAIAIAVCNRPGLLVADEPTSALDPSIQAQIVDLLRTMKGRYGLAVLWISHDLALVSEVAERVAVLYHGRLIECGRTADIFRCPAHPYTSALIECQADMQHRWGARPLAPIAGSPPAAGQEVRGCPFSTRCPLVDSECSRQMPMPAAISEGHWAACFRPKMD
jgi:oligopeptide/dipeptide ABC transporter ATP-binding protein